MLDVCFKQAVPILKRIEEAGYEAVFVGGSVRDAVLGKDIHDVDIATSARPEEVKRIFKHTVDVGIEHGTVLVIENGEPYEVTTYRSESEYVDFRKPKEVTFIRTLEHDLARRDFTMNAIAMDWSGNMIDPFGGKDAIASRLIDTVGDPQERFEEDALRMMRAARFVSQLSFTCTDRVVDALIKHGHLLSCISIERVTAEFEKLLMGSHTAQGMKLLFDTGLFKYLPGLGNGEKALRKLMDSNADRLSAIEEKWAALLLALDICAEESIDFLRKWKLPSKRMKAVKTIMTAVERDKLDDDLELFMIGRQAIISAWNVNHFLGEECSGNSTEDINERWLRLPLHARDELAVNGQDLMEWCQRKPGPWMKETFDDIIGLIISRKLENKKEAIRREVEKWNQKSESK
ncbi:MAG: CCA tRNA nucleotidyltransferase [Bacillus sp. (in: firmicutes)]